MLDCMNRSCMSHINEQTPYITYTHPTNTLTYSLTHRLFIISVLLLIPQIAVMCELNHLERHATCYANPGTGLQLFVWHLVHKGSLCSAATQSVPEHLQPLLSALILLASQQQKAAGSPHLPLLLKLPAIQQGEFDGYRVCVFLCVCLVCGHIICECV